MFGRCDSLLVVRGSLLFDVRRFFSLLFVVCWFGGCWLAVVIGWCVLFEVACVLIVVYCSLFLFVVRYVLCVVSFVLLCVVYCL